MNWYYLGVGIFFILWEILYLIQRKNPDFGIGVIDGDSWIQCKFVSLLHLVFVGGMGGLLIVLLIGAIRGLTKAGYGLEALVSVSGIVIFFGLNWIGHKIFDGRTKKKR